MCRLGGDATETPGCRADIQCSPDRDGCVRAGLIAIGTIDGFTYAFIGLERMGGIMVYDVTHPQSPRFIEYVASRDVRVDFDGDVPAELRTAGDLGPESIVFVDASDSPTAEPMLIVANEVSGTTSFYSITVL